MTESIVLFSPWFALNPSISHEGKKFWHWFLHVCALMCAYTGLAVIIINKHNNLSLHFTTWHGTFGIVVCCLIAVQSTGGIIQLEPSLLPFKIRRVILKRLHAVSGTLTFIGVLTTLVLSLYSNWFLSVVFNDATWWIICSCPVTIGLIVIVQFIRNHFLPVIGK
jgi:cytochrome b-561 domain-containing protein 2